MRTHGWTDGFLDFVCVCVCPDSALMQEEIVGTTTKNANMCVCTYIYITGPILPVTCDALIDNTHTQNPPSSIANPPPPPKKNA